MITRSFFPSLRSGAIAGLATAALFAAALGAHAQVTGSTDSSPQTHEVPQADPQQQAPQADPQVATPAPAAADATLSATPGKKQRKGDDKVVQSKDTKKEMRKQKDLAPTVAADAGLPDKVLYDKAVAASKKGHYDVARLDLQTLLNTYPDSQYQMKAKLAIGDSWYREGGTAALTQAEQEYKDFITFFPNAPEAAEAQMRVGDIYFRQMDKPDRDYAKATHAEEEYRLMIQQFPDSPLVPQAKQRLREVQEVMATREASIAAFYGNRNNFAASIARYQTVADTYPQYSHMDDVLIGLGDAYEAEARYIRTMKLPEAGKARLEKIYDDEAISAYSKVVLEHSASPHVEDAKDRLDAMNVPIPTPSPEQVAASVALENSRRQYRLQDRAKLLIMHQPDVVMAARDGEPTLTDPAPTLAPHVTTKIMNDFKESMDPNASKAEKATVADTGAPTAPPGTETPVPNAAPAVPAKPLAFEDVPTADGGGAPAGAVTSVSGGNANSAAPTGNSIGGVEILNSGSPAPANAAPAAAAPNAAPNAAPADNGGLKAVGPVNSTPLPAIEKPTGAPDAINDIQTSTPAAQAANANGKKTGKPGYDKDEESSSKHKKKKGLNKLNPF